MPAPGAVYLPRGVPSRGFTCWGYLPGGGVPALGNLPRQGVSQHALRQTPPPHGQNS